jgi:uncharacterized protein
MERTPEGIRRTVQEAFRNCPKFIQRRVPTQPLTASAGVARAPRTSSALDSPQIELIRRADTLFIASAHPDRGADASHRGGRPGFVEVSNDGAKLAFPDYTGNRMFQTLGNIAVNPRAGLLLVDWERGTTLQLTGEARIVWDGSVVASRPGAERRLEFEIDAVLERLQAVPDGWKLIERHRINPAVKAAIT